MKADANQKYTKIDNIAFILLVLLLSYFLPVHVICWNFVLIIAQIDGCG